jgi:hypothetical protein
MYEDENGIPTGRGSVIIIGLEEAQRAYSASMRHCGGLVSVSVSNMLSQGRYRGEAGTGIASRWHLPNASMAVRWIRLKDRPQARAYLPGCPTQLHTLGTLGTCP